MLYISQTLSTQCDPLFSLVRAPLRCARASGARKLSFAPFMARLCILDSLALISR
jgi:hypothetical protein